MSGRPNLSGAFAPAPAPARGAALQGLLAPKRRGNVGQTTEQVNQAVKPERREEATAPKSGRVLPTPAADPDSNGIDTLGLTSKQDESVRPESERVSTGPQTSPSPGRQRSESTQGASQAKKASETVSGGLRNVGVYLPPALLAVVKDVVHQARTTYADLLIDAFEALDEETISSEFAVETVMSSSGMPRRAPRKRGEAGIQIQLRLDGLQVAWLDEKVVEMGAPSRSALVSAALKLHVHGNLAKE